MTLNNSIDKVKKFSKTAYEHLKNLIERIAKHIPKITITKVPQLIFAGIGSYYLLKFFRDILKDFGYFVFSKSDAKIFSEYGAPIDGGWNVDNKIPWVLVTGASSGIGKAYSHYFAAVGLNVVLVARDYDKLSMVEDDLKKINPSIETKVIVFDFSVFTDDIKYRSRLFDEVKDLDISILVNNVGTGGVYQFDEITFRRIYKFINVNVNSHIQITRLLIPKLQQRIEKGKKAAIINYSASCGNEF